MKQLCPLDLLEAFVWECTYVHPRAFACPPMCLCLCLHLCVFCIIAPSHSNYKMHLIHYPIEGKKKKKTPTASPPVSLEGTEREGNI